MTNECKECGGDPVIADIARRMGHRPDIAYARVRRLEDALKPFAQFACSPKGECTCHNCVARDLLIKEGDT